MNDLEERARRIAMTSARRSLNLEQARAFGLAMIQADSFDALPPWAQEFLLAAELEVEERRKTDPKWYAHLVDGDFDPGDPDSVVPVWCDACDWEGVPLEALAKRTAEDPKPRCPACGAAVRLFLGWHLSALL